MRLVVVSALVIVFLLGMLTEKMINTTRRNAVIAEYERHLRAFNAVRMEQEKIDAGLPVR